MILSPHYWIVAPPPLRERLRERLDRAMARRIVPAGPTTLVAPNDAAAGIAGSERASQEWVIEGPHGPHLLAEWLASSLADERWRVALAPPRTLPETAFARALGGRVWASVAEWRCPSACIEPGICPATRQPKSWRIEESILAWAASARACVLFAHLRHLGGGVWAQSIAEWDEAARNLQGSHGRDARVVAATVSACHARATVFDRTSEAELAGATDRA